LLSEAPGFSFQLDLLFTGTWEAFKNPPIKTHPAYLGLKSASTLQVLVSIGGNKNVQVSIVSALKLSYHLFASTYGTCPNLSQLFCACNPAITPVTAVTVSLFHKMA